MNVARLVFVALLSTTITQSENASRIFVYAQQETATHRWQPVMCDGALVARIKNGTFFAIDVAPGRHVLYLKDGVPAFIDLKPGDEAFVRIASQMNLGQPTVPVLDKVNPKLASKEMQFLSYIDARQVLSTLVSKVDPRRPPEMHLKMRSDK